VIVSVGSFLQVTLQEKKKLAGINSEERVDQIFIEMRRTPARSLSSFVVSLQTAAQDLRTQQFNLRVLELLVTARFPASGNSESKRNVNVLSFLLSAPLSSERPMLILKVPSLRSALRRTSVCSTGADREGHSYSKNKPMPLLVYPPQISN